MEVENDNDLDSGLVIDAAFQIIDASLNSKALFQEMCHLSRTLQGDSVNVTMTDLLSVTCRQMQKNKDRSSKDSPLSTPSLAMEVIRLSEKTRDTSSPSCQKKYQEDWRVCLDLIKESLQRNIFLPSLFTLCISKRDLSIAFLWDLHKVGAYNLEAHLTSKVKEPNYRHNLSQHLTSLCKIEQEREGDDSDNNLRLRHESILTGVTNLLVNKSFLEEPRSRGKDSKMYLATLDLLLRGILDMSGPSSNDLFISPFTGLGSGDVGQIAKKKFSRHALSFCLDYKADFIVSEHTPSVTDYKPIDADKLLELLMKQLLECLSPTESITLLSNCLKCGQVNSRTTRAFLASLLSMSDQGNRVISDYTRTSLTSGLEESDATQITSGFYVARICCHLNSLQFPCYRDWYQKTFGEESSSIAISEMSFVFLVKCLTQWVPHDGPEYLKAHILRRPFIPAGMRDVYDSYIALARTRLKDLKIPISDVSSGDPTNKADATSSKEQKIIQMQQEIERCVKTFEEGGKIPMTILEASIFRKPYFVGVFLPALLKPRCLPDRPDSRMRLIEEMRKCGKIPSAMVSAYIDGCEMEKQNLLEGVFDVDDEGDEMMMTPIEQLQFRLNLLAANFHSGDDKKVSECLSHVKERVHELVITQPDCKVHDQDFIKVNLCKPLDSLQEQIVSKFILCLHLGFELLLKEPTKSTREVQRILTCLDKTVAVLVHFPILKTALVKYILNCLNKKCLPEGVSPECLCVSSIGIACSSPTLLLQVTDQKGNLHDWNNIIEACDHFLSCNCQEDITLVLRFYFCLLYNAKHRFDGNKDPIENMDVIVVSEHNVTESQMVPQSVAKKTKWLCSRCKLLRQDIETLCQSQLQGLHHDMEKYKTLLQSDWWDQWSNSCKLTFDDWFMFELGMDPTRDMLAKRQRLSHFWESCGKFGQQMGISHMCTSLFRMLADHGMSEENKLPMLSNDSFSDLLSLLKGLLLQLPSENQDGERRSPWLLSVISGHDKTVRSRMLSLSLQLHPHLLVCDNKHGVTPVTQNTLDLIHLFAESDLNCGGYFPVDIIIFIMQTSDCFIHCPYKFVKLLRHPAIFTSLVKSVCVFCVKNAVSKRYILKINFEVHYDTLKTIGIIQSSLPEEFNCQFHNVIGWLQRLVDKNQVDPMEDDGIDYGEVWMKASAWFGYFINTPESAISTDLILPQDSLCLSFLWELITTWFVHNFDKIENFPCQMVHELFMLRHPAIVIKSLRPQKTPSLAEFRQQVGFQSDLEHVGSFAILRKCSAMPMADFPVSVCNTLSVPLIKAYVTLLERITCSMDICKEIPVDDLSSISRWLQSLVKSCHPSMLSGIYLETLHTCDPLLYRAIYIKTYRE